MSKPQRAPAEEQKSGVSLNSHRLQTPDITHNKIQTLQWTKYKNLSWFKEINANLKNKFLNKVL